MGFDFNLQTSHLRGNNNFEISAWAERSFDAGRRGQWAAGGRIDYPNDRWDVVYRYWEIGANFNPDLGFVPRRDIRSHYHNTTFKPRINRHGIRRLDFEFEADVVTDFHNRLQNRFSETFSTNLSYERNAVVLSVGSFTTDLVPARLNASLTHSQLLDLQREEPRKTLHATAQAGPVSCRVPAAIRCAARRMLSGWPSSATTSLTTCCIPCVGSDST